MRKFVYMAVAMIVLTAALALSVTLGTRTTSAPVPTMVQASQSVSALTTRADVFAAYAISPYDHVQISIYNTSGASVAIAGMSVLVTDNTTWTNAANLNLAASSVPVLTDRTCAADHSLADGAKCFIEITDNTMINLKVRASATQAASLTTIITGRKR